jgi:hypothetical protein
MPQASVASHGDMPDYSFAAPPATAAPVALPRVSVEVHDTWLNMLVTKRAGTKSYNFFFF